MRLSARAASTPSRWSRGLDLLVHFDAGEELRTEISAKFTPRAPRERPGSAAGLRAGALADLIPNELFALTLSAQHRPLSTVGCRDRADRRNCSSAIVVGESLGAQARRPCAPSHERGATVTTIADVPTPRRARRLPLSSGSSSSSLRRTREEAQVEAAVGQAAAVAVAACGSRSAAPAPAGPRSSPAPRAPIHCCRLRRSSRST